MKNIVLSAVVAASALIATQASAHSYSTYNTTPNYGSTYYGGYSSGYAATHGLYQHIGPLDAYQTTYTRPRAIASGYRTPTYGGYASPAYRSYGSNSYVSPSYSHASPSYSIAPASYSSYVSPSYNSYVSPSYSNYSTPSYTAIQPASYTSTIRTVPYSGYTGSYYNGCRC